MNDDLPIPSAEVFTQAGGHTVRRYKMGARRIALRWSFRIEQKIIGRMVAFSHKSTEEVQVGCQF